MYLGYLILDCFSIFPVVKFVLVVPIPADTEEAALKVAVNGLATAPTRPFPTPLKKPPIPPFLAESIGFVINPVIPIIKLFLNIYLSLILIILLLLLQKSHLQVL